MFAFGFSAGAALYDVFCEITGFGGRTNAGRSVAGGAGPQREIRIEFVTTVNNYAPWRVCGRCDSMTVNPGKMYYATFTATNLSAGRRSRRRYRALRRSQRRNTSRRLSVFVLRAGISGE